MSRSFSDPDTHFELVISETPFTVDGYNKGEPTGEVRCMECDAVHENIDEIPHDEDCSQRFCRSWWWTNHLTGDQDANA
jgi:hypothetical protein